MTGSPTTTLGEWLKSATLRLKKGNVESPELSASLILSETTGYARSKILGFSDEWLETETLGKADRLLDRRLRHEPMAYILGRKEFRDLTLEVSPSVLIPRPETEELIDLARSICPQARILVDAGTGSGCIPLCLVHQFPDGRVFGIDVSFEALQVAKSNDSDNRVHWIRSDWLSCVGSGRVDLITANPPYLTRAEMETLEPQVREYEPVTALDGGEDGCDAYRRLIPRLTECLKPGGTTVLEIGPSVADRVGCLLSENGLVAVEIHFDLAGRKRFATAKRAV